MRLLAAGLLALSACGRLDFDERLAASDAPESIGHDEDGDGIPDVSDPCPHVPGDTTDSDGDGVGDACDVHPNQPTEHWLEFYTMRAGDQPFQDITGFTQEDDALRATSDSSPIALVDIANARVDLGWTINATIGAAQHQIAFGFDSSTMANSEYYFVELNENINNMHDAAIVSYDMTNGYVLVTQMDPGSLHAGTGYSRVDVSNNMQAQLGWQPSELYNLSAATPGYVSSDKMRFSFNGLDVSLRYLAIIATN